MKNILVPIDFSDISLFALSHAISMVKKIEGRLFILFIEGGADENKGESFLTTHFHELGDVDYRFVVERHPDIIEGILEEARKLEADMICLGTYGGEKENLPVGGFVFSIIEKSDIPVLTIPKTATLENINRILFASDYKKVSPAHILNVLPKFARIYEAEVHILNVENPENPQLKEDDMELTENTLEYFLETLKHSYRISENDDIEAGLNEYIKAKDIDMLAMMPRKHESFEKAVKGRLVKNIVMKTKVPLLTFHA